MLLAKPFFATFSEKTIVDASTSTTGHYALSFGNRDEVDALTRAAVEAGGRELHEAQDMGIMGAVKAMGQAGMSPVAGRGQGW